MYPAVVMGLCFSPFAAYALGTNILFDGEKSQLGQDYIC